MVLAFTQHLQPLETIFSPRRVGLDHPSFRVASREALDAWAARLDELGIENLGVQDEEFACAVTCKDPAGIALEFLLAKPR